MKSTAANTSSPSRKCRWEQVSRYGLVGVGRRKDEDRVRFTSMVESHAREDPPRQPHFHLRAPFYILQPRHLRTILDVSGSPEGPGARSRSRTRMLKLAFQRPQRLYGFFSPRSRAALTTPGTKTGFHLANGLAYALSRPICMWRRKTTWVNSRSCLARRCARRRTGASGGAMPGAALGGPAAQLAPPPPPGATLLDRMAGKTHTLPMQSHARFRGGVNDGPVLSLYSGLSAAGFSPAITSIPGKDLAPDGARTWSRSAMSMRPPPTPTPPTG
jgi:hypothetical protein